MGKRITPLLLNKKVTIDVEKVILIVESDNDDENDVPPVTKRPTKNTIIPNNVKVIDLSDDEDVPLDYTNLHTTPVPKPTLAIPVKPILKPTTSIPSKPILKPTSLSSSIPKRSTNSTSRLPSGIDVSSNSPKKPTALTPERKVSNPSPPFRKPTPSSSRAHSSAPTMNSPQKPALYIPEKWSPQSSLETRKEYRESNALLSKVIASAPERKLSLPRSALLSKNSAAKRSSAIVKAISPLSTLPSKSTSLKRLIESPERMPSQLTRTSMYGPPPTRPNFTNIHGFPERLLSQSIYSSLVSGSPPERRISNPMFATTASPQNLRRPKSSPSPFSKRLYEKRQNIFEIDDENGEEEDLESFISVISSTRRIVKMDSTSKAINMQCPVCHDFYPKDELGHHAAECMGKRDADEGEDKIGRKRGIRNNTIAAAVAMDESERKRLNKGKIDTGPTNYYADSESILALDGVGFNSEVTGISWESAGQTRFR